MLGYYSEIGTSSLSGGAFNWGSLWSGVKSFGNTVKNYGTKVWNSQAGQALRQKLADSKLQEKVIDGISTGIHGAVDLARQRLNQELASRLEPELPPPPEEEEQMDTMAPAPVVEDTKKPLPVAATALSSKRPREPAEELPPPPSYDEIYPDGPPVVQTKEARPPSYSSLLNKTVTTTKKPLVMDAPASLIPSLSATTRPAPPPRPPPPRRPAPASLPPPPAPVVVPTAPASLPASLPATLPSSRTRGTNWQNTLNSITGLGVRAMKRRRCYR